MPTLEDNHKAVVKRKVLEKKLNKYLEIYNFQDYGPNGLQIQGRDNISTIAFAVSATADSIKKAVEAKADALIVHHGLFWKFHGVRTITGPFANRVKPLIQNDINLLGYHLPLDAHPVVGNAAVITQKLSMTALKPFGDHKGAPTGLRGNLERPTKVCDLQNQLREILNHEVILSSPNSDQVISSLGIITGGANGDWTHCIPTQTDAYLTGEMSEHDWHEAQEAGIHMFAGGHHATEQFGVQALQEWIEKEFNVKTLYVDSKNPA